MTDVPKTKRLTIDETLARGLVSTQFPQWADLPVKLLAGSGWDNRTFRLGEHMVVRLPSAADYALQVEKEQEWLPRLASFLPLQIPTPLAMGEPADGYPWKWSIYRWLEGDTAAHERIADLSDFATSLAQFLIALQRIDPTGGPLPGPHNFYRGGALTIYDTETRQAIAALDDSIDVDAATEIWGEALAATWHGSPMWIHGDVSAGNLLVEGGRLSSVIDFGMLGVGDPACDLSVAWTLLGGESREVFRAMLPLDAGTWARARGWTLWKASIVAAGLTDAVAFGAAEARRTIDELLADRNAPWENEFIIGVRKAREESVRFFSSANRRERELWVASEFLVNLGLPFEEGELEHITDDPPDVRFRDAAFEIKEILDEGRRRHAEFKASLEKARSATTAQELLEPLSPRDITYTEVCALVEKELEKLQSKYAPTTRAGLDLLFYVNLDDVFGYIETPLPPPATFERYGFRSVSVVMGRLSGVLMAATNASPFLSNGGPRVIRRQGSYE